MWTDLVRRTDADRRADRSGRSRDMRLVYIWLPDHLTIGQVVAVLGKLTFATPGRAGGNGAPRIGVREWERVKARRLLGMGE